MIDEPRTRSRPGRAAWVALALTLSSASGLITACAPQVPPATAAQRAQVHVTLYTTRWCPVCAQARGWLHARGIPFIEHDVESDPRAAATFVQLSGRRVVPVIDVEGEIQVGFVAEDLRRAIDRRAIAR
ncbi:MAG: glutaredoxin family protein [Sandaracinaceae bacterium]